MKLLLLILLLLTSSQVIDAQSRRRTPPRPAQQPEVIVAPSAWSRPSARSRPSWCCSSPSRSSYSTAYGRLIEDPFCTDINSLPLDTLARTIEVNLRQRLGERDLPDDVQPVEGVLS